MKAAILESLNHIRVKEVPEPACGEEEMIVEPQSVSVCGSDVRIFRYGNKRVVPPTVIGHEFAGRVIRVGKKVKNWKVGDRITMGADVPDMGSGREYTLKGMGNLTPENLAIGYQLDGAFQQQMVLDENSVKYGPIVRIPGQLADDDACLTEPLACAIHGLEMARMGLGKSIAVIGLGPIGCMVLELSRHFGASRVFAIQRSKKRLEMAREFLPDARFIATEEEDPVEVVMDETDGRGVDLSITTAGTTAAQEIAVKVTGKRGYVNFFAGLKEQPELVLNSNLIHYNEMYVMGTHGSNLPDVEKAVELLADGKIQAKKYISRTYPLDQIIDAFEYHESRNGLKVIVKPQL
jgi:L-iditol 2-dehydrogenase